MRARRLTTSSRDRMAARYTLSSILSLCMAMRCARVRRLGDSPSSSSTTASGDDTEDEGEGLETDSAGEEEEEAEAERLIDGRVGGVRAARQVYSCVRV